MNSLLIRFVVPLENGSMHGPAFHRWLPDGEQHSLNFVTKDKSSSLRIWFKRFGFSENSEMIRFNITKNQVDPNIMRRQGVLQGGPLFGELMLNLKILTEEEIEIFKENLNYNNNDINQSAYERVGEKVVALIEEPINKLLNLLRFQYGQHWLPSAPVWDKRNESIGGFCQNLKMQWSIDSGISWNKFIPNTPRVYLKGLKPPKEWFREFLTKEDWNSLQFKISEEDSISFGAKIIMEARSYFEIGDNPSYSFVLGVSGLEIAIEELFTYKKRNNDINWLTTINIISRKHFNKRFKELGLAKKVRILGMLEEKLSGWIDDCTGAISTRNAIVHKGERIYYSEIAHKQFNALVHTTGTLILNPLIKYPRYTGLNTLLSEEEWNR
ncbi:hypothetical protein [Bacillus sp. FJAT-29814]|uniref:hypothetical protein n=1 Tax=Bacillus sp. FJAT-29814 TaxID=1729688 RepID=UPI00083055FF|nr:hypothetical protein [Bacillus sp. FJAT-29814]